MHPVGTLGAGTAPLRGPNPPPQPPAIVETRGETATKNGAGDASFVETRGETAPKISLSVRLGSRKEIHERAPASMRLKPALELELKIYSGKKPALGSRFRFLL